MKKGYEAINGDEYNTYYGIERYVSKNTGWVDEGCYYDTYEEAFEEVEFANRLYQNEKFRVATYTVRVIFKEEA